MLTVGGVLTYEDVTDVDSVGLVTARTGIESWCKARCCSASISRQGNAIFSGITTFGSSGTVGSGTSHFNSMMEIIFLKVSDAAAELHTTIHIGVDTGAHYGENQ